MSATKWCHSSLLKFSAKTECCAKTLRLDTVGSGQEEIQQANKQLD